uniref:Ras-GEF domain-containing protein n=1 Tax=Macrostomum lignano TaxID=282301 RepID=A0A1I8FMN4_9PLAT
CRSTPERVQLIKTAKRTWRCSGQAEAALDVWGCLALLESDGSKPLNGHYAYLGDLGDRARWRTAQRQRRTNPTRSCRRIRLLRMARRLSLASDFVADGRRQKIPANWRRSVNGHAFRGPSSVLPGRWPECAGAGGYWRPGASAGQPAHPHAAHHLLDSLTQEEEAEIAATKACFRWAKAAMEKALRQRRDGSTVATFEERARVTPVDLG